MQISSATSSNNNLNQLQGSGITLQDRSSLSLGKKDFLIDISKMDKSDEAKDKIEKMLADIDELRNQIDFDLTVENVMKYKKIITSFLEFYTENAYQLKDLYSRNKEQYNQKMTIVKKIEDGLNEMDDIMGLLDTKNGHLEMLNRIGKINGLILDLKL